MFFLFSLLDLMKQFFFQYHFDSKLIFIAGIFNDDDIGKNLIKWIFTKDNCNYKIQYIAFIKNAINSLITHKKKLWSWTTTPLISVICLLFMHYAYSLFQKLLRNAKPTLKPHHRVLGGGIKYLYTYLFRPY